MPNVSVIIPSYNHAVYLKQRIDSVLSQTYQDFEIIILDDCSTDNSRDIIEIYRNNFKTAHVVFNTTNSGSVFKQWNRGIGLARGKYIWIAESDDYANPDFLSSLLPVLEGDESIGFVYSDSYCHTSMQNGELNTTLYSDIRNQMLSTRKWNTSYTNDGRREIEECLIVQCTVNNASAVLFRRSALLQAKPFDVSFKYFGDWYCYLKMCMHGKVSYVNEPLNHYRDHSTNASKNLMRQFSFIEEYFKIYSWAISAAKFINKERLVNLFRHSTSHSMRKGWSLNRLHLYSRLFIVNPFLFARMFDTHVYNLISIFRKNNAAS